MLSSEAAAVEIRSGWLVKRGGLRKNWKRRFFRVSRDHSGTMSLKYFVKETSSEHLGHFELAKGTEVPREFPKTGSMPDFVFMVRFPRRELFLGAANESEKAGWVDFLRSAVSDTLEDTQDVISPLSSSAPPPGDKVEGQTQTVLDVDTDGQETESSEDPLEGEGAECILGGDSSSSSSSTATNTVPKDDRRRSSARFMFEERQQINGDGTLATVLNLNKLSMGGHALIFAIAFFPSLCYTFIFSEMMLGADFFIEVTAHSHLADYFYYFAVLLFFILYVLDVGLWEGAWARAKFVCMSISAAAIVVGAITSANEHPSYPMAIFLLANISFFLAAKRHPVVRDVKNDAFLRSLAGSLLLNSTLWLGAWIFWMLWGHDWERTQGPLSTEIGCEQVCQAAYLMWVAPLLVSGTSCLLGITTLIFSRQLQNGQLKPLRAFGTLVVCLVVVL